MSASDFDEWMDGLRKKAFLHPQLLRATVELTYGCNLRCVHCFNPTHEARGERTTQEIFRILDGLALQGCLWVGFTGGEMFTRRDAMEILWYAKRLGMIISILSNATMITPSLADQILALEPFQVDISVYGATAETYEKVTGIPGSFEKFVRGVDLLIERGVRIALKVIVLTVNIHEFEAMRNFSIQRKVRCHVSTQIHPKSNGSREPLAYRITPEQEFEIWRKLTKKNRPQNTGPEGEYEGGCDSPPGKLFDCLCGKSNAAVTPYGKMNLCVSMHYPQIDLAETSIREAWQSLVDLVAKMKPGPDYECEDCSLARHCERGSKDAWLEEGRFDAGCSSRHQTLAQLKAKFLENPQLNGGV